MRTVWPISTEVRLMSQSMRFQPNTDFTGGLWMPTKCCLVKPAFQKPNQSLIYYWMIMRSANHIQAWYYPLKAWVKSSEWHKMCAFCSLTLWVHWGYWSLFKQKASLGRVITAVPVYLKSEGGVKTNTIQQSLSFFLSFFKELNIDEAKVIHLLTVIT